MSWVTDILFVGLFLFVLFFILAGAGFFNPFLESYLESYDEDCIKYSQELNLTHINATEGERIGRVKLNNRLNESVNCVVFVKNMKKIKKEYLDENLRELVVASKWVDLQRTH